MVTEVTAFKAEDGSVYPTRQAAVEADAMKQLGSFDIFNHASRLAIITHAAALVEILGPVAAEQRPQAGTLEHIVAEAQSESR